MRAFISVTMLALASTQASADFEVLKKERGWVIGVNSAERTCTAFSAQNHQGTRLAFIWALEDANWAVVLQNPTWKLRTGQRIRGRVYVDRDLLVTRRLEVIGNDSVLLSINKRADGEGEKAFEELSAGLELRVEWSGGTQTRIGLTGSAAALTHLGQCAGNVTQLAKLSRPRRQPQVAGYTFQIVPREEAIVMATRFMSSAGLGPYELAPSQNGNTVVFRLRGGRLFLLNAARGQTATADDYVGSISGQHSKACKGTSGSIVKRLPSTDGSVIRQLIAKCAEKGLTTNTVATVVRKPDGLLVNATVIAPPASSAGGFVSGLKPTPQHDEVGSGYVDAALEISR